MSYYLIDRVRCLTISNNNKYIISGSEDKSIKLFDLQNGQQIFHFQELHEGKDRFIFTIRRKVRYFHYLYQMMIDISFQDLLIILSKWLIFMLKKLFIIFNVHIPVWKNYFQFIKDSRSCAFSRCIERQKYPCIRIWG